MALLWTICYNERTKHIIRKVSMSAILVMNSNPYLKDPQKVAQGICKMVASSSAIEGIYVNINATPKKGGYRFKVTPQSPQKK